MSAIFKSRKIPRHLVIQQEARFGPQPRLRPWRMLLWLLLLTLLTGLALHFWPAL
jgi:hypothetical protein